VTRKSELEAIRQSILNELFRMCIEMGRDPDTLNVDSWAYDEPKMDLQNNFSVHCHKLQIVEKQLREIP
jgi:hypothetical protein